MKRKESIYRITISAKKEKEKEKKIVQRTEDRDIGKMV
jgi:hypothetical protein